MDHVFVKILLAPALLAFALTSHSVADEIAPKASTNNASKPNIVLINLDDADYRMFTPDLLELYPNIKQLAKTGVSFSNLHVTTPFCGPSRAALFRGQYAHRTGVRVNMPEVAMSLGLKGGYSEFLRQGHDNDELGVWMKNAGYRTMMIGKYHHNGFDYKIPPGWDDFYMSNGASYQGTYRFTNLKKTTGDHSRNGLKVYRTDQEADDAVRLIEKHLGTRPSDKTIGNVRSPIFLYLAPLAPHRPRGPDFTKMVHKEKYGDWHSELQVPPSPDFDEAQISDKPPHRQSPPYTEQEIETLHLEYRCRAQATKSVDDMLGRVVEALKKVNEYENTYILLTSDNGTSLGQHRLHNKLDPYQMSTRVPLFVVGPGIGVGSSNHLLAHIDICATILDLGKAEKPAFLDAKSFETLLKDPESHDERSWRQSVVLENWSAKWNRNKKLPCMYSGLRYFDRLYVEWATGDKEYYDLDTDPFELENVYTKLSDQQKQLLKRDLQSSRNVKMSPLVCAIPEPIDISHFTNEPMLHGYAEDDTQVRSVNLQIRNSKSNKYWNGTAWVDVAVEVPATLAAADQQMVAWSYPANAFAENDIDINVTARAIDDENNKSDPFSLDVSFSK